jgi:predicted MFS family arabinose efflux permease
MFFRIAWLALGAFAIGTEGFVVAGVLPQIAGDLEVSIAQAGQLVTIFAITYAVGSPILSALSGNLDRRRLLILSMLGFVAGNLLAAQAGSFAMLALARVVMALTAGLYMPAANAVAVSLAPPERRGTAISIVTGGVTIAVAFGVPLGTWLGAADWRMIFLAVAGLGLLAVAGLVVGLPRSIPAVATTLRQRIAVARRPGVLLTLSVTTVALTGAFTVYTFMAPFLAGTIGLDSAGIAVMLCIFGVAAAVGNAVGGQITDRFGATRTARSFLALFTVTVAALSVTVELLPTEAATLAVGVAIAGWGVAGWGFYPAQMVRLVRMAPDAPAIVLSLSASALYLGTALGAALGAATVAAGGLSLLGWVGAACGLAAMALLSASAQKQATLRMQTAE